MQINITEMASPKNAATIDRPDINLAGNTYSKTQLEDRLGDIEIGNNLGFITLATPTPPNVGIYRGQASEAGTYVNFGGTVVTQEELKNNSVFIESKEGIFTKFVSAKIEPDNAKIVTWSATTFPSGSQVIYNDELFQSNSGTIATDIPGISNKWVSIGGDTKTLNKILNSFLESTEYTYTLERHLIYSEVQNRSVFGVNSTPGILRVSNEVSGYSEPPAYFNAWKDVPTRENKISRIEGKIPLIGNGNGTLTNVSILGRKGSVFIPLLFKLDSLNEGDLVSFDINISEYDSVSFMIWENFDLYPDTYNGSYIKFYSSIGGEPELDQVKNYIDAKIVGGNGFDHLDLIDFGCKGDGVTDDTQKINEAIIQVLSAGGGTLYGRTNKFAVSSLIVPDADWSRLEIAGAGMPTNIFGTIGNFTIPNDLPQMEIISNLQNSGRGIINVSQGSSYANFNMVFLSLKNLRVRAYNNPNCHGINAHFASQLNLENIYIDTGVYNVQASEPTHDTAGLITPKNSNAAFTRLRNVSVQGFARGIDVNEHTDADQISLHSCGRALSFKFADHACYFNRVLAQRNKVVIEIEGSHIFAIDQLNCEYVGTGQFDANNAWQKTIFELNDPNNLGIGNITYANVRGEVGKVATFRINGGSNVIVKRVGSETRLTGSGIIDPNPIT